MSWVDLFLHFYLSFFFQFLLIFLTKPPELVTPSSPHIHVRRAHREGLRLNKCTVWANLDISKIWIKPYWLSAIQQGAKSDVSNLTKFHHYWCQHNTNIRSSGSTKMGKTWPQARPGLPSGRKRAHRRSDYHTGENVSALPWWQRHRGNQVQLSH